MGSHDRFVRHEFWFDYSRWGLIGAGGARDEFSDPDDPGVTGEFDGLVTRRGSQLQVMAAAESGHVTVEWRAFESFGDFPRTENPSTAVVIPTPKEELRLYDCHGSTQGTLLVPRGDTVVRIEVLETHEWGEGVGWGLAEERYRVSAAPADSPIPWTTSNPSQAMLYQLARRAPAMELPRPTNWERPGWHEHDVDDQAPFLAFEFLQAMRWISRLIKDRGELPEETLPVIEAVMKMWEGDDVDVELLARAKAEVLSYLHGVESDIPTFEGIGGRTARAALALADPPTDDSGDRISWAQSMLAYS